MCVGEGRKGGKVERKRSLSFLLYIFIRLFLLLLLRLLCIYKRWISKGRIFQSIGGGSTERGSTPASQDVPARKTTSSACPLGMGIGKKREREKKKKKKRERKQELNTHWGKRPCRLARQSKSPIHNKNNNRNLVLFPIKSFKKKLSSRLLFHTATTRTERLHLRKTVIGRTTEFGEISEKDHNLRQTLKKSIMNEREEYEGVNLFACSDDARGAAHTQSRLRNISKIQRPYRYIRRPRLFLSFEFQTCFLLFEGALSRKQQQQAFNAPNPPIHDTPTAWSTNPINDSFLRTWNEKWLRFRFFRFQGITKALKCR